MLSALLLTAAAAVGVAEAQGARAIDRPEFPAENDILVSLSTRMLWYRSSH